MSAANAEIMEIVSTLKGKAPWGVRLGHGSFVTMEFGDPDPRAGGRVIHGEWHLWLYMCNWRIEAKHRIFAGSNDDRKAIEATLGDLSFDSIESIDVIQPSLDLSIQFRSGIRILTFSSSSDHDEEEWKLFTPGGKCLLAYGDGTYEYARSDEPSPRTSGGPEA
ncbi:MAG: hypothetical protein WBF06_14025 [Candidatus Acidiferrales bacterium]